MIKVTSFLIRCQIFRMMVDGLEYVQSICADSISFFCTSEEKMHQFQSNNGGHDRSRQREWRISNFPRCAAEPFNVFFENSLL